MRKRLGRIGVLVLTAILLLGMTACGGKGSDTSTTTTGVSATNTTSNTAATTTTAATSTTAGTTSTTPGTTTTAPSTPTSPTGTNVAPTTVVGTTTGTAPSETTPGTTPGTTTVPPTTIPPITTVPATTIPLTTVPPTTIPPTTIPPTTASPTEPQLSGNYPDAVIVATDKSPKEWRDKATYLCTGGTLPSALKSAISSGNKTFLFAPGEYDISGAGRGNMIRVGSNTKIAGVYKIIQPADQKQMLYPDSSYMAVFSANLNLPSTTEATYQQRGEINVYGSDIVINDIAINGHAIMKLEEAKKTTVKNVLIHNYRGTYPNGQWCNMGYSGATGSLWLYGDCEDIDIINCQVQCSSHHGFLIHGKTNVGTKDVMVKGVRCLYSGCGQLRGSSQSDFTSAKQAVPETGGYGYRDWSVAFDICESNTIENVTLEDCYALEGWKSGFYTEPESTGGSIKNLKMIRCRSDRAGQRTLIPGSNPKATIVKEEEGANFFMQGGYFKDCVSVEALKCGWLFYANRTGANAMGGGGKVNMVDCGDMGSPYSFVTEMYDTNNVHSDGFWSLNATEQAFLLFGTDDFQLTNNTILVQNQAKSPIKVGYMYRMCFWMSRDANNQNQIKPGGKYDVLRAKLTNSKITGTIYSLPTNMNAVEIVSGAAFNGASDPNKASGITLKRDNTTVIKISDYVK